MNKDLHAQQELINSEITYRLLFQKSSLGHFICTQEDLKILKVNDTAVQMYGYTQEEFLSMDIKCLRPLSERPFVINKIRASSALGIKYLVPHVKKNGDLIIVQAGAVQMDYNGQPCYLITLDDHTHRNELEKQIEDLRVLNQKNITKATIDAQEKQKEEIANELHDNVNQVLATTKLILGQIDPCNQVQKDLIGKCNETITYCIEEIRRLSRGFTPPSLREITLEESVRILLNAIPFGSNKKVSIEVCGLDEGKLEQGLKLTVYRIIQEQLNNILKHAEASNIFVSMSQHSHRFDILVSDNGKGFDVRSRRNGIGLRNIRNRAELYNGEMFIHSVPGEGCELIVSFELMEK
ncbi:MAG TPA: ATP-binding protein [Flavitalea sp.]|nr:ATP-binding protein [Flavitalea sp.]